GLMLLVAFILFRLRMRRRIRDVNSAGKSHTDDLFVCENNAPKSPLLAALPKHHVKSNTWS
ncbi:MAG: cell surface protein, partial [Bifidobacterium breve]|nr:cell surface protein [Bifidobacterium breve]